ncbi:MAG: 2-alkenal reductase [Gammaproteobacteria bacterium]|jgi:S1-C subfamily serine protease|nr:2-alkenal reductase [Gammaproteobacteria bacterium]HJN96656.1 trypsin-like peptidase domain-containing protein [Gammaproteobacteria bacterium]|tara:strand:- start:19605 stop:20675 length:1071 start_codon:yes stop_codon:yes gene_type:complete
MKTIQSLVIGLAVVVFPVLGSAQEPDYSQFKTNDEANNIEVFKQASPSVVHITNSRLVRTLYSLNPQEVPQGSGTGFIWNTDGYIVTNFHVIQQANRVIVTLQDGTSYDAVAVGVDPDKDLAVLKIDAPAAELVPVSPGDSSLLEVGRKVIAIGNPFGLDTTMTVGVVSALGREIDSMSRRTIRDVIQTDAAINPGNSGGPLLNSLGQLVGVNTQIYSPSGANSGIGFAIPVNIIKRVIPQLITYGRVQTPILGITRLPQPDYYRELWGIEGVIVLNVVEGTDPERLGMRGLTQAQRGRIQLGDVVVEIDGQSVGNEDDYANIMEQHRPGDVVRVRTRRDNQLLDYDIELQAPPDR